MTSKVIQGFFIGGGPRLPSPVAQPTARRCPPGSPVPAFAGRQPVAQPRLPGPPAPAFAARPPVAQRRGAGDAFSVDPGQLGLASGGGRPLPEAVRGKMEAALGADFSNVRVHVGPQAERIGAIAFTLGSDVYFAPGRYQPDTAHGQQLLGHELAHVVQQRAGRVRNPLGSGIAVVQDHALEAEADRLGRRAAAHQVAAQAKMPPGAVQPSAPVRISPPLNAQQDTRLERQQSSLQRRSALVAPRIPSRPFATHAVQPPPAVTQKLPSAMQPYTTPGHGAAQAALTKRPVIQCWQCRECRREITYSDDHLRTCSSYYLRTYETRDDRDANYYDRPRGGTRTRSGSVERQYSNGDIERRHYHENRYGGGYVERRV